MNRRPPARHLAGVAGWLQARALAAALVIGLTALAGLAGCASPPSGPPPPATRTLLAPADTPLGALAAANGVPVGRSGFRPLLVSSIALQAGLALMADARVGIDLQTYDLGNDATGHQILRALRDAAARGVRVRLLIEDFHSTGMTDLLLGLAAQPGVAVRL